MEQLETISRLEIIQARFQQKQLREKEQRLLQLCDQRQKRAYQVARKGSAERSLKQTTGMNRKGARNTFEKKESSTKIHGGKVRQMFDERRQTSVKGIDRSHPLEPLDNMPNYGKRITNSTTSSHATTNGSSTSTRQALAVKRVTRSDHNSNVKGGELLAFTLQQNQQNGNNAHFDVEKNGTLKIPASEDDKNSEHRVTNAPDNERFQENLKKIPQATSNKVPVTKPRANKSSAAEARLERFKTVNARRNSINAKEEPPSVSSRNSKPSSPNETSPKRNSTPKTSENNLKDNARGPQKPQEKTEAVNDGAVEKEAAKTPDPISRESFTEKKNAPEVEEENSENSSTGPVANSRESAVNNKDQSRPPSSLSSDSLRETPGPPKKSMASKARPQSSTASPSRASPGSKSNTNQAGDVLANCKICGRHFVQERLARHEQICAKSVQKKRKQFDSASARVKGTELEPFVAVVKKGGKGSHAVEAKSKKAAGKSNWRVKHEDFINTIRSAKQVQAHLAAGGKLSDLPPPPPSDTSDYIQCPHCGRKFNQGAAERHIPKCEKMQHNKSNPRAPQRLKR